MRSRSDLTTYAAAVLLAIAVAMALWPSGYERFGYRPDPEGAKEFASRLPTPTFAQAAPDAMAKARHVDTFLWRAMDAAHRARYGEPFKPSHQRIGSCVAHGAAHAIFCSESVAWSQGERDEPPLLVHQGAIYGGSRVEARGRDGSGRSPVGGYSDGSTGYHAAKWLRDWGVIYKQPYSSRDCTVSDGAIEKEMGAFGCGGEGDGGRLDAEAKKVPCLYVTQVRTWDELVAAVTSGHPVTIASSQGFAKRLDAQSFDSPSGVWMHQMMICGVRFDREGAAIMNSWGNYLTYTAPRWPSDLPDGTFWADRRVVERILSQGDSWAISEVKFKHRDINHNNWLGAR
jgi:hypothetical protein